MIDLTFLPNERRHFVHGRIKRAITGFVTSGFNPISAAGAFIAPVKRPARNVIPRTLTARTSVGGEAGKGLGRRVKFGGGSSLIHGIAGPQSPAGLSFAACDPGFELVNGRCRKTGFIGSAERLFPGGATGFQENGTELPGGETVMGRYGSALTPGSKIIDRADCTFGGTIRGMQLGNDGLCYNKKQITNKERMWPQGRRPLLTGGDMRAISIAARAGARLERTTKRLQKIGLMKRPAKGPSRRLIAAEVRTEMHHSK